MLKSHLGFLVLLIMFCSTIELFKNGKKEYHVAICAAFVLWAIAEAFMWVFYFFFIM